MTSSALKSQVAQSLDSMLDTIDILPFFSYCLGIQIRHLSASKGMDDDGDGWKMIIELNNSFSNEAEP